MNVTPNSMHTDLGRRPFELTGSCQRQCEVARIHGTQAYIRVPMYPHICCENTDGLHYPTNADQVSMLSSEVEERGQG